MIATKTPCNDCPFRKNSLPGWLADYSPLQLHSIVMSETAFPCHLAQQEFVEWKDVGTKNNPVCAGSLRYMKKGAKMPRRADLAALIKKIDVGSCDNILSITEFFEHHSKP
jgi:hypothetical protein